MLSVDDQESLLREVARDAIKGLIGAYRANEFQEKVATALEQFDAGMAKLRADLDAVAPIVSKHFGV